MAEDSTTTSSPFAGLLPIAGEVLEAVIDSRDLSPEAIRLMLSVFAMTHRFQPDGSVHSLNPSTEEIVARAGLTPEEGERGFEELRHSRAGVILGWEDPFDKLTRAVSRVAEAHADAVVAATELDRLDGYFFLMDLRDHADEPAHIRTSHSYETAEDLQRLREILVQFIARIDSGEHDARRKVVSAGAKG